MLKIYNKILTIFFNGKSVYRDCHKEIENESHIDLLNRDLKYEDWNEYKRDIVSMTNKVVNETLFRKQEYIYMYWDDKIRQKDFKNGRITIEYEEVPSRRFSISDIVNFHDHQKALAYLSQFVDKKFFDGIGGKYI